MAKGLLGGMTDYNHQSFADILNDLEEEQKRIAFFRDAINLNIDNLTTAGYWGTAVPGNFKNIVAYSMRHFNTTITELDDIRKDLLVEVKEHHIKRLQKISNVAEEINAKIGQVWHQQYENKDYGNEKFRIVETIYADARDMAVNLLDVSNIAERLKDFIGRTNLKTEPIKKSKWERPHKIALASLIIAIIVLIFGNNLYDRFTKINNTSIPFEKVNTINVLKDTIILKDKLPYLENYQIIDKGLYIKYYFNDFVFSGVNVDTIQINARSKSSEAMEIKKDKNSVIMDINAEPYIEFEYKGKYYSIELAGSHYTIMMTLKEIVTPTMKLKKYKQI